MSKIALSGNASGTGTLQIAAPNTSSDYTLTLPAETGTVTTSGSTPTFTGAVTAPGFIPNSSTVPTNGLFLPAANTIAWSTNTNERMRIDSSGNVGINTTSPSALLNVSITNAANGSTTDALILNNTNSNTGDNLVTGISWMRTGNSASNIYARIGSIRIGTNDTDLAFSTNNGGTLTERGRFTSGGYFKASNTGTYIGSTDPIYEFSSDNADAVCMIPYASSTSFNAKLIQLRVNRNTTNASYYFIGCYNAAASAYKCYIADSGNLTNTNGSYGTISDAKLKQDITDATPQWDDIKNLRFRKYRLKSEVELDSDAKPFLGLVAQEVELVSPGLIEEHKDTDGDGKDLGTTTKAIKTSILYMKAVKALQEAMTRIETLEAQNAAFEARLAALEAK